jgi:hypothetical protein
VAFVVGGCGEEKVDCTKKIALKDVWRRAIATDDEAGRRRVAGYVIDCGALRGKSRREVRQVLGAPEESDGHMMFFYLGPDGLKMDSEDLVITFGADHTVIAAAVAQG